MSGTLMRETVRLLQTHKKLEKISRETGLSVYWLQKLSQGIIRDPSVNKIQKLWEHMTQQILLDVAE